MLKIELPAHERGRGPDEVKRFDRLKRKLERHDLKDSQREAAAAELAALERAPAAREDKAWRDAAASEISRRLGMARLSIKVMIRSIRTKRPDIDIRSFIGPYGGYWLSDDGLRAAGGVA